MIGTFLAGLVIAKISQQSNNVITFSVISPDKRFAVVVKQNLETYSFTATIQNRTTGRVRRLELSNDRNPQTQFHAESFSWNTRSGQLVVNQGSHIAGYNSGHYFAVNLATGQKERFLGWEIPGSTRALVIDSRKNPDWVDSRDWKQGVGQIWHFTGPQLFLADAVHGLRSFRFKTARTKALRFRGKPVLLGQIDENKLPITTISGSQAYNVLRG